MDGAGCRGRLSPSTSGLPHWLLSIADPAGFHGARWGPEITTTSTVTITIGESTATSWLNCADCIRGLREIPSIAATAALSEQLNIDHFRNGSFGDRGRETGRRDIDQPWRQGEIVRDRLSIQPTATSFRPAPDRRANGPERIARPLPTVVRNSPGENLRGQEQFRRITNPEIPSLPSRAERRLTEPPRGPDQGIESRANTRIMETPQRERENSGQANLRGTRLLKADAG